MNTCSNPFGHPVVCFQNDGVNNYNPNQPKSIPQGAYTSQITEHVNVETQAPAEPSFFTRNIGYIAIAVVLLLVFIIKK